MASPTKTITDEHVARKYLAIRAKCLAKDLPFDLTLGDVRRFLSRKTCAYTGIKLVPYLLEKNEVSPDDGLTLDRKVPSLGYTKTNVVTCSYWANQKKGDLSVEFIQQMHSVLVD